MKYTRFLILTLSLGFLQACETEVDLFGDGPQVPVVFALLDQSQQVQYFRINPTFKGEGDARELAGDTNVTNYGSSKIEVRLYDLDSTFADNPSATQYYVAEETREKLDDNGIFDPNILMYKLETPVTVTTNGLLNHIDNAILRPNHHYRLWMKNNETGAIATSEILMGDINDMKMLNPVDGSRKNSLTQLKFFSGEEYVTYNFEFGRIDGARRYKLEMRYFYWEYFSAVDSILDSVSYVIGETNDVRTSDASVSMDYNGEKFYSIIHTLLEPSAPGTSRKGMRVDLIVTAVGDDLDTYIEVQDATISGLSQERPSYTNIENGLGVFSFRSTKVYKDFFLNAPTGKWIVDVNNDYTRNYFKCIYYGAQGASQGVLLCP